jgi:hypothetical protein
MCTKCGEVKPLSEFYPHKHARDGHLNLCKVCGNALSSAWQHENRARATATQRAWRRANPARANAHQRTWERANKDKKRAAYQAAVAAGITKRCAVCGETKPAKDFPCHDMGSDRYGMAGYCRACDNARNRTWRQRNPDKVRARWREYEERHHPEVQERRAHKAERKAHALTLCLAGATRRDIAAQLGVPLRTVYRWLQGQTS